MALPSKRAKRNTGPWSAGRILSSDSPIVSKDIHGFLVTCILGWESNYDEDDKRRIIDSLPPAYRHYYVNESGRLQCPFTPDFLMQDRFMKSSVKKFKSDVSEGFYEKAWQNQARKAMQERREGNFDEYLKALSEEMFGETAQTNRDDGGQPAEGDE